MLCSVCNKNTAVVFLNKIENGKKTVEGLCYNCAKEKGILIDNDSLCMFTEDFNLYAYYAETLNEISLVGQGTSSFPYEISNSREFEYVAYLLK